MSLNPKELPPRERKPEGGRFVPLKIVIASFILLSVTAGIVGGMFYWHLSDLPAVRSLEEYPPIESSLVFSADGRLLAEFYLERRTFIPHYDIPRRAKKAFIAIRN